MRDPTKNMSSTKSKDFNRSFNFDDPSTVPKD